MLNIKLVSIATLFYHEISRVFTIYLVDLFLLQRNACVAFSHPSLLLRATYKIIVRHRSLCCFKFAKNSHNHVTYSKYNKKKLTTIVGQYHHYLMLFPITFYFQHFICFRSKEKQTR